MTTTGDTRGFLVPLVLLTLLTAAAAPAAQRVIDGRMHHLRGGAETREWAEFPEKPQAISLTVTFDAQPNAAEQTLWIRQVDLKQRWQVSLNGKPLATLPYDENDMTIAWPVKPGMLVAGANTLTFAMNKPRNPETSDDVRIGAIRLDDEPRDRVVHAANLAVRVTDEATGEPTPCRLTIVDASGSLVSLGAVSSDHLAVRDGVIYTLTGAAETGLAPGIYTLYASRGFEWSASRAKLVIATGETRSIDLKIRRAVDTRGLVACDTHLHTFTHSRHGDATMTERMIVNAGEGIEVPVACDHNLLIDYDPEARRIGARPYFTPVVGCEVTTRVGHFNVFPLSPSTKKPDEKLPTWPSIYESIRAARPRVVILNHPRDLHSNFRPFDAAHWNAATAQHAAGWRLESNAVELVNSGALQSDPMRAYHDWFATLNAGYNLAGVGSSDSHDVTRHIPGQGRTYLPCGDRDVSAIDIDEVCRRFLDGSAAVSMGLLTQITIDGQHTPGKLVTPRREMHVTVRVLGPEWVAAGEVELYMNGRRVKHATVNPTSGGDKPGGEKWSETWIFPLPAHDVFLVAVARGPGVTEPFWNIPRSYQPTTPDWRPYVIGSSGVVRLDADGDGKFTPAAAYAAELTTRLGDDLPRLFEALRGRDRAVAIHVAKLLEQRGVSLDAEPITKLLAAGMPQTQEGFSMYTQAAAKIAR